VIADHDPSETMAAARPSARRVAAIDCGTNSIRLLIADVSPARAQLTDVTRRMEIVRLGQGVDATGRLAADALARTLGVLEQYAAQIRAAGAAATRMVATSATRDASNAAEFTAGVLGILGIEPEVITGAQEARLSFTGATAELAGAGGASGATAGLAPPYLVVDIGGGSTEFVTGGEAGAPDGGRADGATASGRTASGGSPAAGGPSGGTAAGSTAAGSSTAAGGAGRLRAISTDIGCVRLTERHLRADPPTQAQVAAATADIDAAIDTAAGAVLGGPGPGPRTLVGLAGSVTTVAAIALGLPGYDAGRIHHARISAEQVHEVAQRLLGQTRAQRAAIGPMHPGRVDVIGAGALILDRIVTRLAFAEVVASEHDILDGIAWSLAADA
jgi:exopolyphosphatase/guanosine-5'-triphosphate,3'-diphosphate pyrophosphatase